MPGYKYTRILAALMLALIGAILIWVVLVATGFNRTMGGLGIQIAILPVLISGAILFLLFNSLFKQFHN